MVTLAVLGDQLDLIIKVFSNLNNSEIVYYPCLWQGVGLDNL